MIRDTSRNPLVTLTTGWFTSRRPCLGSAMVTLELQRAMARRRPRLIQSPYTPLQPRNRATALSEGLGSCCVVAQLREGRAGRRRPDAPGRPLADRTQL
jgi:hypothetical protein